MLFMYQLYFYSRQLTAIIFIVFRCSLDLIVKKKLSRWEEPTAPADRIEEGWRSVLAPLFTSARVKDAGKWSPSVGLCGLALQKQSWNGYYIGSYIYNTYTKN